jgi:hypothetical protein
MATTTQMFGLAGEFRVMSELLLRGYNPAKSYLENGADLILMNGIRIEVKCAHKLNRESGYSYNVKCGHAGRRRTLPDCDFIICWCIDDEAFYIIPFVKIKKLTSLALPSKGRKSKYSCYKENWDLLRR